MGLGSQMVAVAIGWQVYAIHRSAFDLGLIGLFEFVPLLVLALPAASCRPALTTVGLFASSVLNVAVTLLLLVVTLNGASKLWPFLALAAATGVASAVGNPAARALGPSLVSLGVLQSAMALRTVAFQVGSICGPASGGLLFSVPCLVRLRHRRRLARDRSRGIARHARAARSRGRPS